MARIRQIKPEFFLDDELASISRDARLLFIGLWTIADREGRLEDRPAKIKAQIFPYDGDISYQKIDALLGHLANPEYIYRYEINGHKYIQIRSFSKHQRCHIRETDSTIPAPTLVGAHHPSTNLGSAQHQPRCPASTSTSTSTSTSGITVRSDSKNESSEPPAISFPLADKSEHGMSKAELAELSNLYPGVDPEQELLKAKGWLIANPTRRKTQRGIARFLHGWLSRAQDRGNSNKQTKTMTRQEEAFAFLDQLAADDKNAEPSSK